MAEENYKRPVALCIGKDCIKEAFARGMCKTHYSRWRIHGDCNKVEVIRHPKTCEVEGCSKPSEIRWKKAKSVCNAHWQCLYRHGTEAPPLSAPLDPMPLCCVHKCKTEVRSRNSPYCEKHYGRVRRGVPLGDAPPPMYRYVTPSGYVVLKKSDHPLSDKSGNVYEHRAVAHENHEGVCPACFWCDALLSWDSAVIDHLDENKSNNDKTNLVVACNACNRARGAMLPFIRSMKPEAFDVFVRQAGIYRKD